MSVARLTNAAQDYLKIIWAATEWADTPITVGRLAERMGVRAATVSDGIRRLSEQGLVTHEPYGSIELTSEGRALAIAMVRRHRLIETFLVHTLDYTWDEVHDEAEVLEHAVSDTLIDRIDAALGHPTRDPHGDPIPDRSGDVPRLDAVTLAEAPLNAPARVVRISDADPALLRHLADKGIRLDADVTVLEHRPFAGDLTVRVAGPTRDGAAHELSAIAGTAVWVRLNPEPTSPPAPDSAR